MLKKKLVVLLTLILVIVCTSFGCARPKVVTQSENTIVITVSSQICEITSDLTLLNYMNALKDGGDLSFEMENGMVVEFNGIKQTSNSYWMLYTDDSENSNSVWGTITYEGKTYASASSGAEILVVKTDCTYIWCYQTF